MNYNTCRTPLRISEYGRNVQKMIDVALTIDDREKRTAFAYLIIESMIKVRQEVKHQADYRTKLWHHLFIMSDYRLDVDSPVPLPSKDDVRFKPSAVAYNRNRIQFKPYGSIIENMITIVADMPDSEERDVLSELIAQQLKRDYLMWNVKGGDDETIIRHFEHLSQGKLKLKDDFKLHSTNSILATSVKKQNKVGFKPKNKPSNNNKPNNRQPNGSNKPYIQGAGGHNRNNKSNGSRSNG
ncbi:MAG: DUF4290 domain-containing protein [Bacteroidales bacterium]|nr:DUF4290 domain-containing protein [Bacteroidales bacterium]